MTQPSSACQCWKDHLAIAVPMSIAMVICCSWPIAFRAAVSLPNDTQMQPISTFCNQEQGDDGCTSTDFRAAALPAGAAVALCCFCPAGFEAALPLAIGAAEAACASASRKVAMVALCVATSHSRVIASTSWPICSTPVTAKGGRGCCSDFLVELCEGETSDQACTQYSQYKLQAMLTAGTMAFLRRPLDCWCRPYGTICVSKEM